MTLLDEFLAALPDVWDKTPGGVPVVQVLYRGDACWATVADETLTLEPVGGSGLRRDYDLRPLTLQQLVDALNADRGRGFSASLLDEAFPAFGPASAPDDGALLTALARLGPLLWWNLPAPDWQGRPFAPGGWYWNQPGGERPLVRPPGGVGLGALSATVLVEGTQDLVVDPLLHGATSLLWALGRALAAVLRPLVEDAQAALAQMDVRSAESIWLDRWGRLFGVLRHARETDRLYRRRLYAATLQPRVTPRALRRVLLDGYGMLSARIVERWQDTDGGPGDPTLPLYTARVECAADAEATALFGAGLNEILRGYRACGVTLQQQNTVGADAERAALPDAGSLGVRLVYADNVRITELLIGDDGTTQTSSRTVPAGHRLGEYRFGEHRFGE